MSVSTNVPTGIVKSLKKWKKGIPDVIKELKDDHGITAKYEHSALVLYGDDSDILDLCVEMLEKRVGVTNTKTKKELGGKCTVKWTFTDRAAVNIKRLFRAETDNLKDKYKVIVSYGDDANAKKNAKGNGTNATVVFACTYTKHADVDSEIKQLEGFLKNCKNVRESISSPKDFQTAKQFAMEEKDSCYYEYEKDHLIIWGKNEQTCNSGLEEWRTLLNHTKDADDGKKTMSEKDNVNSNDTQNVPNTDTEIKENSGYHPDKETLDPHTPESTFSNAWGDEYKNNDVVGAYAMSTDTFKREDGKTSGSGKSKKYSFNANGLRVYVYNTSITDIKGMDAITNAANEHMAHGGGVAYYISKAAGSKMDEDCRNYIKLNSKLPVTDNFASIPGKLKCKGIIHAVGPIWGDYKDKEKCASALYQTIWNVLQKAVSKSWRTVAIPAISSGIFGVPKKLCAEMYVKAFIDYGCQHGDVVEVHFVDLNQDILDLVIKAHMCWVAQPSTLEFKNALTYGGTQSSFREKDFQGSRDQTSVKPQLQFVRENRSTQGESMYEYRVGDMLKLRLYNGDLTKLKSVNVVAVPVTKPVGCLLKEFKKLHKTYSSYVDRKCMASNEGSVHLFETSNDWPDIANVVLTSLDRGHFDMRTLAKAFKNLFKYKYKGSVSLAVPLIGLRQIDTRKPSSVDELCACIIDSILDVANEQIYIKEIHLVNNEPETTASIQKILKQRTQFATGHDMTGSQAQPQYKYPQEQDHQNSPEVGWIKHMPLDIRNDQEAPIKSPAAPKGAKCAYHEEKEAVVLLDCGKHSLCKPCHTNAKDGKCSKCKTVSQKDSKGFTFSNCPICQDVPEQPKTMPCKHVMCTACYDNMMKHKPQCPICGYIVGIITGNQPPGDMYYRFDMSNNLPGFQKEQCGTIVVRYIFPDGKQQKNHPKPGSPYQGIEREAYLPNNKEGQEVLQLLRIAFDRKLIFTIGESTTTGKKGVITWNDIHHKTRPDGGPQSFGYPDPTYLQRVREELEAKGVKLPAPKKGLYPDLSLVFGYSDPTYFQRVREEVEAQGVKLPAPKKGLYPDLSLE